MAARWRVVGQEQREELSRIGTFTTVMEITFEVIDTGTIGTVKIPLNQYTAERVADEIQGRADSILAVAQLGGQ